MQSRSREVPRSHSSSSLEQSSEELLRTSSDAVDAKFEVEVRRT